MLFFIRYQDEEHQIRVESRHDKTFVSFDGGPETPVDLVYHGNDCLFLHNHRVFHANIVGNKSEYTVWRPKGNSTFTVESEYRRIVGMLRGQDLDQTNHIYAKMPGKIVKILKRVGDLVEKGDSVLVMEAMKMENEIRATLGGKISNLCVKESQAVETGTLLVELEPLA